MLYLTFKLWIRYKYFPLVIPKVDASVCHWGAVVPKVVLPLVGVAPEFIPHNSGFKVANTWLGLSCVAVSVPPATVKSLELEELSVTELPSFKIQNPVVP